jgi:hypothetical protein
MAAHLHARQPRQLEAEFVQVASRYDERRVSG